MITLLIAFHFLFFFGCYKNPMRLCTSELLEIFWCHWEWLGKHPFTFRDRIYYYFPMCMPHLATFYPMHWFSSLLSRVLSKDNSFRLLVFQELTHFLVASFLSFKMFSQWYSPEISLFGSVTLTYMAYNIKLYNLSFIYTMAWIPGMFIHGPLGWVSFGMAILGGGWPVLVYIAPLAIFKNPECLWGVLIGLPQIVPFFWYFPRSIKSEFSKINQKFGRVRLRNFLDLVFPSTSGVHNGLFFPEFKMYLGIIPLMFLPLSSSKALLMAIVCVIFMVGLVKVPFRASARFIYTFCFCLIWASCDGLSRVPEEVLLVLTFIQAFCLLQNRKLILPFPFYQFQLTPSEHIKRYSPYSLHYPFSTGYYFGETTRGYTGGQCLKSTAKRLGITDPNGEPFYH